MSTIAKVYRSFVSAQDHRNIITPYYNKSQNQSLPVSVCSSPHKDTSYGNKQQYKEIKTDREYGRQKNYQIEKQSNRDQMKGKQSNKVKELEQKQQNIYGLRRETVIPQLQIKKLSTENLPSVVYLKESQSSKILLDKSNSQKKHYPLYESRSLPKSIYQISSSLQTKELLNSHIKSMQKEDNSKVVTTKQAKPLRQNYLTLKQKLVNSHHESKNRYFFVPLSARQQVKREPEEYKKLQSQQQIINDTIQENTNTTTIITSSNQQIYKNVSSPIPQQLPKTNPTNNHKSSPSLLSYPQFTNHTQLIQSLSAQLNQKQKRASEFQKTILQLKNNINTVVTENTRILNQKQKHIHQLHSKNQQFQFQINQLSQKYITNQNQLNEAIIQIRVKQQKQQELNEIIKELKKREKYFREQIEQHKLNSDNNHQTAMKMVYEQLMLKQKRVVELEHYNQMILIQLENIKKDKLLLYSDTMFNSDSLINLPFSNSNNQFEQSFRHLLHQLQSLKHDLSTKQLKIQQLISFSDSLRLQTQHLKNQLRIQQFKRTIQLRNCTTLFNIQKQSFLNQIKDLKHEILSLKQKNKDITRQINSKNSFIQRNIIKRYEQNKDIKEGGEI